MRNPRFSLTTRTIVTLFALGAAASAAELEARVDPRVELVSIVFRLAGNPEYNMPNSTSPYADDVESHFGQFRDHAAVQLARKLRAKSGISFDAVMSLAVHLDDDLANVKPRTPLDPRPPLLEGRWTVQDATTFIAALGEFSRDTGFPGFVIKNQKRYDNSSARVRALATRRDFVGWCDRFFGARPQAKFTVIVGMLEGGGNYGVSMRHHDGREEITPVIGIYKWTTDGLPAIGNEVLPTIVHEFCHAYTNALVDNHAAALEPIGEQLFQRNAQAMRRQAYATGRTVLYETLVRACVTHYMRSEMGAPAGAAHEAYEMSRGFKWTRGLAELLREYEASRDKYKTLDDFMPRLIEHLDGVVKNYDALLAKFPMVVATSPASGAADVDAAMTNQVTITFDRPMRDKSWSITGGGPKHPKFGQPAYDAARTTLTVPVRLEPGKEYHFGINGGQFFGFISEDGYPAEANEVTFKTKP